MKKQITITMILSLILGIMPLFASSNESAKMINKKLHIEENTAKFALLIGINDYTDKDISDLEGCENDVELMRGMLEDVYGFNSQAEIKRLISSNKKVDEKPTRQAILESFEKHLIGNAKKYSEDNKVKDKNKGATIVFYYSGHGSYLPDNDDKDESDGVDETIVPMDSNVNGLKDGKDADIRDDEFDRLFQELSKYTSNITFIFDSCHSGTATRGIDKPRSLERKVALKGVRGDVSLDESMDSEGENYVTISGSLPNEKSYESELPSQSDIVKKVKTPRMQKNGFMTYFLVQTLRQMPDATYRDAMKIVGMAVQKRNSGQHPQVEGDIDRSIFGSAFATRKNTVDILSTEKKGENTELRIDAGKIVGAYPGGLVSIYKKAGDKEHFATGQIISSDDFNSTVNVSDKVIPENARVVLTTPFFGDNKRIVALDLTPDKKTSKEDTGLKLIKSLEVRLAKNDYVTPKVLTRPLEKRNDWNIAVVRDTYANFKIGKRQVASKDTVTLPNDDEEVYFLIDNNNNPLFNFWVKADDPKADEKIQTALEKFVRVDNLRTLGNESSELGKGLEFKVVKLKTLKNPPRSLNDIVEDSILEGSSLKVGDFYSFVLFNKTGKDLFTYIYSIGTDGSVKLLYGPKVDGDILRNNVSFKTLNSGTIARISAPLGVETFVLLAATQRFAGELLESPAIARERSKGLYPLEKLLRQASTNTRSSDVLNFEFSGWTTKTKDIEILD